MERGSEDVWEHIPAVSPRSSTAGIYCGRRAYRTRTESRAEQHDRQSLGYAPRTKIVTVRTPSNVTFKFHARPDDMPSQMITSVRRLETIIRRSAELPGVAVPPITFMEGDVVKRNGQRNPNLEVVMKEHVDGTFSITRNGNRDTCDVVRSDEIRLALVTLAGGGEIQSNGEPCCVWATRPKPVSLDGIVLMVRRNSLARYSRDLAMRDADLVRINLENPLYAQVFPGYEVIAMTNQDLINRIEWETTVSAIIALAEDASAVHEREASRRQGHALHSVLYSRRPSSSGSLNISAPDLSTPRKDTPPQSKTQRPEPPNTSDAPRPHITTAPPSLITPNMTLDSVAPCGHHLNPRSKGGCEYCKVIYERHRKRRLPAVEEDTVFDSNETDYARLQKQMMQIQKRLEESDERNRRMEANQSDILARLESLQRGTSSAVDTPQDKTA